jgi:predicted molibdopterin-dependent oxidoreductase YjgC
LLTSANADPNTKCPEYKVTAVDVRKITQSLADRTERAPIAKGFRQDAFD